MLSAVQSPRSKIHIHAYMPVTWSDAGLTGVINDDVCSMRVRSLDLSHNNILGTLPACVVDGTVQSGPSVRVSNNRMSGTLPRLGHHVRAVKIGDGNSFEGNLAVAAMDAGEGGLHTIDASGNRLSGNIEDLLSIAPSLHTLDISGNEMTTGSDNGDATPSSSTSSSVGQHGRRAAAAIANHPSLRQYSIGGNRFGPLVGVNEVSSRVLQPHRRSRHNFFCFFLSPPDKYG